MSAAHRFLERCATATIFATGTAKKTAVRITGTIAKGCRTSPQRRHPKSLGVRIIETEIQK